MKQSGLADVATMAALAAILYYAVSNAGGDQSTGNGAAEGDQAFTPNIPSSWDSSTIIGGIMDTNPTNCSDAGIAFIAQMEGFSATPYPDHKGNSIGYGHLIKSGEYFTTISESDARILLASDVAWAEAAVASSITAAITQNQFDALCSFTFNEGAPKAVGSTLFRKINAGDASAVDEFARWVYATNAQGVLVVNQSLVNRREAEVNLFTA